MKCLLVIVGAAILIGCSTNPQQPDEQLDAQPEDSRGAHIRIGLSSVFVEDQGSALRFYTEVLGFVKKNDIPVGEFRFLTVASPDGPEGIELLLEPNDHSAAKAYQEAIYEDGIPATTFFVEDVQREYERLVGLGVVFTTTPTKMELMTYTVFDDTCGNLIQITQG